jgi:hypothetical protein
MSYRLLTKARRPAVTTCHMPLYAARTRHTAPHATQSAHRTHDTGDRRQEAVRGPRSDQLRDQRGQRFNQKPQIWPVLCFIGSNTRTALFFCACVGMSLANNISARKESRREVGGPAQRLQAGVRGRERVTREHIPPPPLTSFERFQPEIA